MSKKVGLIGAGYWGKKIFSTLKKMNCNVVVVDKVINGLINADFVDLEQLLSDKDVDTVFIATPENTHYSIAIRCLEAGKNIFIEKPLCLKKRQAQILCYYAMKKRLILYVDYIFEYDLNVLAIQENIDFRQVNAYYSLRASQNINKPDMFVSDDLLIHDLYLLRHFFKSDLVDLDIHSFYIKKNKQRMVLYSELKNNLKVKLIYSWNVQETARTICLFNQLKPVMVWEKNVKPKLISNKKEQFFNVGSVDLVTKTPLEKSIIFFLSFEEARKKNYFINKYQNYIDDVSLIEKIHEKALLCKT